MWGFLLFITNVFTIIMIMVYWFKRKYRQIKRVIDFLPMIWKGYDFDYSYAINLFRHQLIRTEKYMSSPDTITVNANKRAKRIKTAIELLALEVVNFDMLNCPVLALYDKSPPALNKPRIS